MSEKRCRGLSAQLYSTLEIIQSSSRADTSDFLGNKSMRTHEPLY